MSTIAETLLTMGSLLACQAHPRIDAHATAQILQASLSTMPEKALALLNLWKHELFGESLSLSTLIHRNISFDDGWLSVYNHVKIQPNN